MEEFIYFLVAGAVLMIVPVFAIAYFQSGFFGKWLKTRSGRGKYVLIKARSKLRDYFEVGTIDGEFLVFGKKDNVRRILLDNNSIYRAWGIACVDVFGYTNSVKP